MNFASHATGLLACAALALPGWTLADEASQVRKMRGYATYQENCSRYHGVDGRGDGPDADKTRVPTADLTRIAARRGGVFPEAEIVAIIDGRRVVRAHGQSGMPVWGKAFAPDVSGGAPSEVVVKDKIYLLVEYLKAIQRQPAEPE